MFLHLSSLTNIKAKPFNFDCYSFAKLQIPLVKYNNKKKILKEIGLRKQMNFISSAFKTVVYAKLLCCLSIRESGPHLYKVNLCSKFKVYKGF